MSLIEGVGDEVTITISLFVVIITLIAAWVSTRVSETRLTHAQLSGLQVRINELTTGNNSQSEEEAGSSTEGTENDSEHRQNETSDSPLAGEDGQRTEEVRGVSETDSSAKPHLEEGKESADHSSKDELSENQSSEVQTNCDPVNQESIDASVNTTLPERTSSNEPNTDRTSADNAINLKIKFLNETERVVRTSIEETVGNFKRLNFAEESQDGRVVHLIFNGQFLRDDNRQLGSYSIVNNCVLHCHISQHQQSPGTAAQQPDQAELDLGQFMVPLFACTIGFVWYLRWQYSYMFNTMSTMSLSAVTVLFMLAVLAAWRG